jgi:hypothetical protein
VISRLTIKRCGILRLRDTPIKLYVIVRTEHAYYYYTNEKRQLLAVYCHFDSYHTTQNDTMLDVWR